MNPHTTIAPAPDVRYAGGPIRESMNLTVAYGDLVAARACRHCEQPIGRAARYYYYPVDELYAHQDCEDEDAEGCGLECDCPTRSEHDRAIDESMRAFLRDPGPPPASMSVDDVERAERGMAQARRDMGVGK